MDNEYSRLLGGNVEMRGLDTEEFINYTREDVPILLQFINSRDESIIRNGVKLLHRACVQGDTEVVKALIKAGVKVSEKNASGQNGLMLACKNGHGDVTLVILKSMTKTDRIIIRTVDQPALIHNPDMYVLGTKDLEDIECQVPVRQYYEEDLNNDHQIDSEIQVEAAKTIDTKDVTLEDISKKITQVDIALKGLTIKSTDQQNKLKETNEKLDCLEVVLDRKFEETDRRFSNLRDEIVYLKKDINGINQTLKGIEGGVEMLRKQQEAKSQEEEESLEDLTLYDKVFDECLKDRDQLGWNCLYMAIENKQRHIIEILLTLNPSEFLALLEIKVERIFLEERRHKVIDTPFNALQLYYPDIAAKILSTYYAEQISNHPIKWKCNFKLLHQERQKPNESICCHQKTQMTLEKNHHPLMIAFKSEEPKLSENIVVASFWYQKWRPFKKLYICHLLYYFLFMVLMTVYMLKCHQINDVGDKNETQRLVSDSTLPYRSVLSVLAVLGIIMEISQLILIRSIYFDNIFSVVTNLMDWFVCVTCLTVCWLPALNSDLNFNVLWQFGCGCVVISWFNFLFRHPSFNCYLLIIFEVFVEFWKFSVVFFMFIIMIGLTLTLILSNQVAHSTEFYSIFRTWTIMFGDIGYVDIFHPDNDSDTMAYPVITFVVFAIFLFIGLILTNMWTGFIINRLTELEKSANRIKKCIMLDMVLTMEYVIPEVLKKYLLYNKQECLITVPQHNPTLTFIQTLIGDFSLRRSTDRKFVNPDQDTKSDEDKKIWEEIKTDV